MVLFIPTIPEKIFFQTCDSANRQLHNLYRLHQHKMSHSNISCMADHGNDQHSYNSSNFAYSQLMLYEVLTFTLRYVTGSLYSIKNSVIPYPKNYRGCGLRKKRFKNL